MGPDLGKPESNKHADRLRIARSLLAMLDDAAMAATTGLSQAEVAVRGCFSRQSQKRYMRMDGPGAPQPC